MLTVLYAALIVFNHQTLLEAQSLFYNGRYDAAAAMTLELSAHQPMDLEAVELRTSALLFQLKASLGDAPDKEAALKACDRCADVMSAFLRETAAGQKVARARLAADPADERSRFLLGKLDLNYVWLQLGELGRKTGWSEYWEARKSLDEVLRNNSGHVRARVARAWIDYIVDTRMPRGTRWILGGGNRTRALRTMREAAAARADVFVHAEAAFALWDLEVRERNVPAAVATARALAREFPENHELARFLKVHGAEQP